MRQLDSPVVVALLGILLAGCQENGYRTEVKGNGQGGVDVQRVAVEPPPPGEGDTAMKPRQESLQQQLRTQQAQIEAMQAQIQQQNAEIQRLKQTPSSAGAPTGGTSAQTEDRR